MFDLLQSSATETHLAPLTTREQEVAALVTQGLTNRQIAEQLVISPRTADNHVQHIFDRLGMTSRAQLAAWVAVHSLRASLSA